jgi:hypothetical protein
VRILLVYNQAGISLTHIKLRSYYLRGAGLIGFQEGNKAILEYLLIFLFA